MLLAQYSSLEVNSSYSIQAREIKVARKQVSKGIFSKPMTDKYKTIKNLLLASFELWISVGSSDHSTSCASYYHSSGVYAIALQVVRSVLSRRYIRPSQKLVASDRYLKNKSPVLDSFPNRVQTKKVSGEKFIKWTDDSNLRSGFHRSSGIYSL